MVWGWLGCGVVFVLMGGLPLLVALPLTIRSFTRRHCEAHVATGSAFSRVRVEPMTPAMRLVALALVSLVVLCAALTALAAGGMPQIKPTAADTAAARATMIRLGDLRPAATGLEAR